MQVRMVRADLRGMKDERDTARSEIESLHNIVEELRTQVLFKHNRIILLFCPAQWGLEQFLKIVQLWL